MSKKAIFFLIMTVLMIGLLSGTIVANDRIHVGITVPHLQSEYWVLEAEGAREVIEAHGGIVTEFACENDVSKQINAVEDFIQMGVDIIIIDAVDSYACIPAIQKANAAGIPIITAGCQVMGGQVETLVCSDHYKGGKLAAEYIIEKLNGKGKVAMFTLPYTIWGLLRAEGARTAFGEYPGIEIVAEDGNAWRDGGPAGVMNAMENILLANPDLDAVWCFADNPAYNAMKALIQNRKDHIIVTGFDGHDFVLEAIKEGTPLKATFVQQPKLIGKLAAEAALRVLEGETLPDYIEVPAEFVTAEDFQ